MEEVRRDPWSVLGLELGETDAKRMRRAYAEGVRAHTPEEDPAGFRAVREAYEVLSQADPSDLERLAAALRAPHPAPAEGPALEGLPPAAPPGPDATDAIPPEEPREPARPHPGVPEGWRAALAEVLAGAPDQAAPVGALRSVLGRILTEAGGMAGGPDLLGRLLDEERPPKVQDALALAFPAADYASLLHQGQLSAPGWVYGRLLRAGRVAELGKLAVELALLPERLETPEARWAAACTVLPAAPLVPNAARKVMDALWRNASPAERAHLPTGPADQLIALGEEAARWPRAAMRVLLARALLPADTAPPLTDDDRETLLEYVADFPGNGLIAGALTTHHPDWEVAEPVPEPAAAPTPDVQQSGSKVMRWLIILLVIGIFKGLAATCRPPPRPPERSPSAIPRLPGDIPRYRRPAAAPAGAPEPEAPPAEPSIDAYEHAIQHHPARMTAEQRTELTRLRKARELFAPGGELLRRIDRLCELELAELLAAEFSAAELQRLLTLRERRHSMPPDPSALLKPHSELGELLALEAREKQVLARRPR